MILLRDNMNILRVASLFAGIGGFDEAFRRNGHEIVYANEWNKYAAQVYEKNFGKKPDKRDIREVPSSEIPQHDIICGGFPCQTFSIAGKRLGFDDTRGTLFREIMRIAKDHKTKYLLLENVKGLLSHDKGRTFAVILSTMDELGYGVEWQVLNSKNFGVPQNRERVFIVGHLRGISPPKIFPITCVHRTNVKTAKVIGNTNKNNRERGNVYGINGVIGSITSSDYKQAKQIIIDPRNYQGESEKRMYDNISPTLMARARNDEILITVQAFLTPNRLEKRQNGRRMKTDGEPSFTLTSQDQHGIYDGQKIRRLTPLEYERLQGFPDGWTEGISDSQRYKCLGNAITVSVVEEIIRKLQVSL